MQEFVEQCFSNRNDVTRFMRGIADEALKKYEPCFCDEIVMAVVMKPDLVTKSQKFPVTVELSGQVSNDFSK